MTSQLTSKGQVTVPKAIRDYLGLKARAVVRFERLPSGEVALKAAKPSRRHGQQGFARLRGRATVRMKTEELMALTRGR